MPEDKLKMTFDPNTIEHLGVRLYSTLPPVLSEIIANSRDADAKQVEILLSDAGQEKEIVVSDDGTGMTFGEINDKYLRIGRNRRAEPESQLSPEGRKVIGKKGIGKLSFFGIALEIEIDTRRNGKRNIFAMNWDAIKQETMQYEPQIVVKDQDCDPTDHGTTIKLKKLMRETQFDPEALAISLARTFIFDESFRANIRHNDALPVEIENAKRYKGLDRQIEWSVPSDIKFASDYEMKNSIRGYLTATSKPISSKFKMRGVTLFSRNKLVNLPEYFSESTSSHFFSYLTGELEVDFIDELGEDVISTHRQSLNWGHPEMVKLRTYLRDLMNWLERDWRGKREKLREEKIREKTGIDPQAWFEALPSEVRTEIESVVVSIIKKSELETETSVKAISSLHTLVPEYPYYHYRHLHPEVRKVSEIDYQNQDYYRAFLEAAKRYINTVRGKSQSTNTSESSMMGEVFGENPKLRVAQHYRKSDGSEFNRSTIENIESGQKFLSMGVVSGCRNPVSHEEIPELKNSGMFSEKDCLDALSLLSHLFHRLDSSA